METYYRWLALHYATRCRRIHQGLIATLFRYNGRSRMGGFLHRLDELCVGRGDAPTRASPLQWDAFVRTAQD